MATIRIDGDEVVLELSRFERIEAVHGDVRLPLASLVGTEPLDDAIHAVHGFRAPGTGVPGLTAVGTYRQGDRKLFAVVHHDTPRGVRLCFDGAAYESWSWGATIPKRCWPPFQVEADGPRRLGMYRRFRWSKVKRSTSWLPLL